MTGSRHFRSLLAGGVCVMALASAAAAQTRDFSIPAGDLQPALDTYARQANVQLLYRVDDLKGISTHGVQGALPADEALGRILEGTKLGTRRSATGAIAIVGDAAPQAGSAGGGAETNVVQELIVTAQKKSENIQVVPIAISAFTQKDLTTRQVAGGPDLMTQVPNMTFTKTNFSSYSIQIRGIGTQAISATTDPAVAVAFNNTPFIRNRFFEQEFYDLERVEVLRGPQGTLYGRNATAGVVNIISAKPNLSEFEAKASGDVANYASKRLEGMINLPLVEDKAALRIAGAWTKRDGFVKNILTGDQTDGRDLWSGRATLGVEPTSWFSANLIYEHFEENDDRLRSGKQLCHKDVGPTEVNGTHIEQSGSYPLYPNLIVYFTQGCLPASLYSPDSFQTPNGFALPYGPAAQLIGSPVADVDTYLNATQSRNLREIETRVTPEYTAANDTVELQLHFNLPGDLTLASETGYAKDHLFSFEDYNRFSTRPGTITTPSGILCDPQLGCTDRMQAGDLSTARSRHFSQEFRLSSNYDGRFNFNLGANFLRYDTEDKYYVFINTIAAGSSTDTFCIEHDCNGSDVSGYAWSNPNLEYSLYGTALRDPNDIHHLNDLGRNYFLSKNPYGLLSYAVFGETYYNLTDNLKLTAGFRWTVDKKTAPQIPSWLLADDSYGTPTRKTIHQEWREPTGRVAIDWKPDLSFTDETLLYASYVRGYKAGGANPPPAVPVFAPASCQECGNDHQAIITDSMTHPQTFKPEFVNAFEIGTKNTLLDGRLTFNLNGFYYDYTGYQISEIVDRSAVNLNFDAKIWGSELEMDWRPLKNLRLGLKGGYENTRMAKGSSAIDLMDRTAGHPGWIVKRPFPTQPSNCIVPLDHAFDFWACTAYIAHRATWDAPNNGEGFAKDLSGNELPNAPHFTATVTIDYTVPLPNDWLVTLHSDLYGQSEAWTRVFNTPGYDRLKAYNNINVAAIFSNERSGLTVMAYVKNILDRDSITGAFLNSDDTGLTTNVFLTEPRLYGLRVTKQFDGSSWIGEQWAAHGRKPGTYYPFQLELGGMYGPVSGGHEFLAPDAIALFPAAHPYPLGVQKALDWASAGGVRVTFEPEPKGWFVTAGVRYGRARGDDEAHPKWTVPGGYFSHKYHHGHGFGYVDPVTQNNYSYATTTAGNAESHTIVDFAIGKDVGLGSWARATSSRVSLGFDYARFRSSSNATLHGRPDIFYPADDIAKYGEHWHRFHGTLAAVRDFEGAGPTLSWSGSLKMIGDPDAAGRIDVDLGLGGSVLWGRQKADVSGNVHGDYQVGVDQLQKYGGPRRTASSYDNSFSYHRSKRVTIPGGDANLGLSYTLGGLKMSGGYRWERYFHAIDGGIAERKTYDRQFDGPYVKFSVGFGG